MPFGKYMLIADGITTTVAASPKYARVNAQNFRQLGFYIKEDNVNAVKVTLEARSAVHAKSEWIEILAVQTIAKDGHLFVSAIPSPPSGCVECEMLNEPWAEMRVKYYECR